MFDRFRYRHMLGALAAARGGHGAGDAVEAYVLGAPTLARLLRAHPIAGLIVRGEVTEAQLVAGQHAPSPVTALIAVGALDDVAAVARGLARGGTLMWFTPAPPHVSAGKVLAAGHHNIWQRAAGRPWLTVSTNLAIAAANETSPAEA